MNKETIEQTSRRDFLSFLGRSGLVLGLTPMLSSLTACTTESAKKTIANTQDFPLKAIAPNLNDTVTLAENLNYYILAKWQDKINAKDHFGMHCDYLAYIPLEGGNLEEGLLWVNHEYFQNLFINGIVEGNNTLKTKAQVEAEMYEVGGSILHIKKDEKGVWHFVNHSSYNRRITAATPIPFAWHEAIAGVNTAIGTLGNCAGGITPWGTVLTCEENYDMFYGETDYSNPSQPKHIDSLWYYWDKVFPENKPEHYGWVVEVNVRTGQAKKLVALGRCAHEAATTFQLPDERVVVYTGDDCIDEHLYKFISDKPNNLETGKLYVANLEKGKWESLVFEEQAILQKHFKSQTEVLIRLREAAKLVGATKLDRPEDIEIDPLTGHILIALSNNKNNKNYMGAILKIIEDNNDKTSLTFKSETFLAGGEETGFACPDNMAFDSRGNLWFTSDIAGYNIGKDMYEPFGNNSLYMLPTYGAEKGKVLRIATAPIDAEFSGPYFSPDGKTLFLCVQHPGEESISLDKLTSHFPDGGNSIPKSCVIAIHGKALDDLINYTQ